MIVPSPRNQLGIIQNQVTSPNNNNHCYQDAPLMLTDLDFFEQEVIRYQYSIEETLLNKRKNAGIISDDPEEELAEVYSEIEVIEQDFSKALGICQHMLSHSKELFSKN